MIRFRRPSCRRDGLVVILLAACFSLSACQMSETPGQTPEPSTTPELPTEGPKFGGALGDSPGKPTPPIGVRYEILGEPQVGMPLDIRITTLPGVTLSSFAMDVRGDTSLSIAPPSAEVRVARVLVNEPLVSTVTVTPLQEGSLRLSVLVQGDVNGERQARSVMIPIQVGNAKQMPEPAGILKTDESGERIISLPADENAGDR